MKEKTILVNEQAYLYLHCEFRKKRGSEITSKYIDYLKRQFEINSRNGLREMSRFTFLVSVDTLIEMLEAKGYEYQISSDDIITI